MKALTLLTEAVMTTKTLRMNDLAQHWQMLLGLNDDDYENDEIDENDDERICLLYTSDAADE